MKNMPSLWNNKTSLFIFLLTCILYATDEGNLTVTTDPKGVEVWINDKYIGDSPIMNKKFAVGKYTIKLIDPIQQVSISDDIEIQPGKTTTYEQSLKAKFGTLKVDCDPEGADVYLFTDLGKTPVKNTFMNPGKYRVEIRHSKPRYIPAIKEVTIHQGEEVALDNILARRALFDTKAFFRIMLGGLTAASCGLALFEQNEYKRCEMILTYKPNLTDAKEYEKDKNNAALYRTLGVVLGCISLITLEIVAFY